MERTHHVYRSTHHPVLIHAHTDTDTDADHTFSFISPSAFSTRLRHYQHGSPPSLDPITTRPSVISSPPPSSYTIATARRAISIPNPTTPCPTAPNAHVIFHRHYTGLETRPRRFPVCISPGRGVIVRQPFLMPGMYGWTCLSRECEVERCEERVVTFPGDVRRSVPEHTVRIVGRVEVEFSVLQGEDVQVEVHGEGPTGLGRDERDVVDVRTGRDKGMGLHASRDGDVEVSGSRNERGLVTGPLLVNQDAVPVRIRARAWVAAANEEFCPMGGTEGVGIWIGAEDAREIGFSLRDVSK
ncbi:hypothetical protein A1O7_01065 [Cladophialophora yegresii CBS 114405]|uniref:Uncharacterized protein n=1 Tax=Cladophialophora yegresii CBS 114405 TaxID=1182544 RepID=W9W9D6_9EURO|nr:uncharacterized protein A1O7_01065 [Cladophialophora yegresii CBS 114405]EXJ64727.1 hypothetical protein A1O7_01065 [Cladophialophora yegresii CBS 114405]